MATEKIDFGELPEEGEFTAPVTAEDAAGPNRDGLPERTPRTREELRERVKELRGYLPTETELDFIEAAEKEGKYLS